MQDVTKGDELVLARKGPICTLSINRPEKRNLLTPRCLEEMIRSLEELSGEDSVRVVVIRGAGEQAFSAGYDIAALPIRPTAEAKGSLHREPPMERAMRAIGSFPYPVIAMINGLAYGGGCELALACDLRIAGESARMGMPPAKLGLVYPYEGLRRFVSVIGFSHTLEIFLTARRYDSASCLRLGLVNEVIEDGDLVDYTLRLAREIAENAPLSLRGTKSALHRIARYPILDSDDEEAIRSLFVHSLQSEDMVEAKQAFMEKRKPLFKGK